MARAEKAMQDIKALRPPNFTLENAGQGIAGMSLIRALLLITTPLHPPDSSLTHLTLTNSSLLSTMREQRLAEM